MGKIIFTFALLVLTACSTGNCRRIQSQNPNAKTKSLPANHVMVFKYDGSEQCQMGKVITLDDMKKELTLQGIEVFSSKSENDGLMHIQQCGSATGQSNVYEILSKDLEKAQKLDFKKWLKEQ